MAEPDASFVPQTAIPSPGNAYYPAAPMVTPHLQFVCRLQVLLAPFETCYEIPNIQGTGVSRSVVNIIGGTVGGPQIKGKVLEGSGADWAFKIDGEKIYYELDARYTLLVFDPTLPENKQEKHYVMVNAKGLYRPGPGVPGFEAEGSMGGQTQKELEWFSHLKFEASGKGPFNWMSGMVANGVMSGHDGNVIIDVWRLTNFPGVEVENFPKVVT